MSTLREIGNKLFKEDLASQKVELASLKDLLNINSNLSKIELKFDATNTKLSALIKEEKTLRGNYVDTLKKARDLFNEFEQSAKSLGIDPSGIVEY